MTTKRFEKDNSDLDRAILRHLKAGETKVDIALMLRVSVRTVQLRCKLNGWFDPNKSEAAKRGYRKDLKTQQNLERGHL
jgi:hypothetical protein